jgi:hypothetical protein
MLGLCHHKLHEPENVELAMASSGKKIVVELTEWVKLKLYDTKSWWSAKTVHAIIVPGIFSPIIPSLLLLSHNHIVIDHHACTVVDKELGFDLLHPTALLVKPPPKIKLKDFFVQLQEDRKVMLTELKLVCHERKMLPNHKLESMKQVDVVVAIHL